MTMHQLKSMDDRYGWVVRYLTFLLVAVGTFTMVYLRGQFVTRDEAGPLFQLPARVSEIERDFEPFKPLPGRVQVLETQSITQSGINSRRDGQLDAITSALNTQAVQTGIAISKIDGQTEHIRRIERTLDAVAKNNP